METKQINEKEKEKKETESGANEQKHSTLNVENKRGNSKSMIGTSPMIFSRGAKNGK